MGSVQQLCVHGAEPALSRGPGTVSAQSSWEGFLEEEEEVIDLGRTGVDVSLAHCLIIMQAAGAEAGATEAEAAAEALEAEAWAGAASSPGCPLRTLLDLHTWKENWIPASPDSLCQTLC